MEEQQTYLENINEQNEESPNHSLIQDGITESAQFSRNKFIVEHNKTNSMSGQVTPNIQKESRFQNQGITEQKTTHHPNQRRNLSDSPQMDGDRGDYSYLSQTENQVETQRVNNDMRQSINYEENQLSPERDNQQYNGQDTLEPEDTHRETQILDKLENLKNRIRELFKQYENESELLPQESLSKFIEQIQKLMVTILPGQTGLEELNSHLLSTLSRIIQSKQQELKFKESVNMSSQISYADQEELAELEAKIGISFNEFYHELFMSVLSTVKKYYSDNHFNQESDLLAQEDLNSSAFNQLPLEKVTSRSKQIDPEQLPEDKKFKLVKLQSIFQNSRNNINELISKKGGNNGVFRSNNDLKQLIREVLEILPARIVQTEDINEDGTFVEQMNRMNTVKHNNQSQKVINSIVVEAVVQNLDQQMQDDTTFKGIDYDQILGAFEYGLIMNDATSFDFKERNYEEEQNLAELEGLDDFLLMDQEVKSPTLLDQLKETVKTYQELIDRKKYKSDKERSKIIGVIRNLQRQIDQLMKEQVKQNKASGSALPGGNSESNHPFMKLLKFDTASISPVDNSQAAIVDKDKAKQERREKCLKGIFDFYCRQQLLVGKKATFEEIQKEFENMNMGEFVRFCLDFGIPLNKNKLIEIFKKISPNHKDLTYDQFKEILRKLFIEINRDKVRNIKKKLQDANKSNLIGNLIFKDAQKHLMNIKNKSNEEIIEEAYLFLELDFPNKVEQKKKGLTLPFHVRDKDVQSLERQTTASKYRMKHYTSDQKQDIHEKVVQLKKAREMKKKELFIQDQNRYFENRKKLLSQIGVLSQSGHNGENIGILYNNETPLFSQNKMRANHQSALQNSKVVLTLQRLTNLNYEQLNSKSEDDFDPKTYGFDEHPEPVKLPSFPNTTINATLITTSPLNQNSNNIVPPLNIQNEPYITQNGVMNGLVWNRGQLISQENFKESQSSITNNKYLQKKIASSNNGIYGRSQPSQNQRVFSQQNYTSGNASGPGAAVEVWKNPVYENSQHESPGNWIEKQYSRAMIGNSSSKFKQAALSAGSHNQLVPLQQSPQTKLPPNPNFLQSQQNMLGYYIKTENIKKPLELPPIPQSTKSKQRL